MAAVHHRRRPKLRGVGYFRRLGPGLVTGIADDDPSGIATYSQVGAASRFDLLWTAVLAFPLAFAVQEATARLGLVTGRGLAALIRERFPRLILMIAVVLVTAANTFNIGADLGSMAAAVRILVPVPFVALVVVFAGAMTVVEIVIPYHRYVRVLRWLGLSVIAYVVVLFVVKVDWGSVAGGTFTPSLSFTRSDIGALLAVFGTTISPYLFFWQTAEEVEELNDNHDSLPEPEHMKAMRGDVFAGMGSGVAIMFAIMVTAAATLGGTSGTRIETADQAAEALKPLAGDLAGALFALGILGTGLLAVPVLAGSTAYALSETFGWREGLSLKMNQAKAFYGVIAGSMMLGLLMNFAGVNPVRALYLSAMFNGIAAGPLIVLVLLLARNKSLMDNRSSGRVSQLTVGVAAAAALVLPLLMLVARDGY